MSIGRYIPGTAGGSGRSACGSGGGWRRRVSIRRCTSGSDATIRDASAALWRYMAEPHVQAMLFRHSATRDKGFEELKRARIARMRDAAAEEADMLSLIAATPTASHGR